MRSICMGKYWKNGSIKGSDIIVKVVKEKNINKYQWF